MKLASFSGKREEIAERKGSIQGWPRTTFTGKTQLVCDIDIAFVIDSSGFLEFIYVEVLGFKFPLSTTKNKALVNLPKTRQAMEEDPPVNTTNPMLPLRSSPSIKTDFMDVVPARASTPDDIFLVGFEFHKADGAVAFDGLALAGSVFFGFGFAGKGGSIVDFNEFLGGIANSQVSCILAFEWRGLPLIRMRVGIGGVRGL